jgi:hypothetical protein
MKTEMVFIMLVFSPLNHLTWLGKLHHTQSLGKQQISFDEHEFMPRLLTLQEPRLFLSPSGCWIPSVTSVMYIPIVLLDAA